MVKISCIQLNSSNNLKKNLEKTSKLIKKAVDVKSDFILTPEASSIMSLNKNELKKGFNNGKRFLLFRGQKVS